MLAGLFLRRSEFTPELYGQRIERPSPQDSDLLSTPGSTPPARSITYLRLHTLDRTHLATMASLLRRQCSLAPARRAFSTSTPRFASLQWDRNNSEALADTVPEYPYGPPTLYKQSRRGLYGEQRIRFGNNVSVKGKNKSRRSWRPNIMMKRLFSKALNRHVQVRVSSRVLRTIDKLGGLDEYLLGEKETRIRELGESGWWLRWAIMQTQTVKKRFAAERRALGLPSDPEELRIEEEDAEATLAAAIPDAEIAELTLDENANPNLEAEPLVSDLLAEDDAFQIEQNKDLPPLRFRVGRNKYIMLTENGWRSLTPSKVTLAKEELAAKQEISRSESVRKFRAELIESKTAHLREELHNKEISYKVERAEEARQPDGERKRIVKYETKTRPMTEQERQTIERELDAMVERQVQKRVQERVQEIYEAPILRMQRNKEKRRLEKIARKAEDKIVEEPVAV